MAKDRNFHVINIITVYPQIERDSELELFKELSSFDDEVEVGQDVPQEQFGNLEMDPTKESSQVEIDEFSEFTHSIETYHNTSQIQKSK